MKPVSPFVTEKDRRKIWHYPRHLESRHLILGTGTDPGRIGCVVGIGRCPNLHFLIKRPTAFDDAPLKSYMLLRKTGTLELYFIAWGAVASVPGIKSTELRRRKS